jgi:hypothetical protein
MNTKIIRKVFVKNANTLKIANVFPEKASIPGKLYPPKNRIEITADEINIAMYSANR